MKNHPQRTVTRKRVIKRSLIMDSDSEVSMFDGDDLDALLAPVSLGDKRESASPGQDQRRKALRMSDSFLVSDPPVTPTALAVNPPGGASIEAASGLQKPITMLLHGAPSVAIGPTR
jgi:hypothetical protein